MENAVIEPASEMLWGASQIARAINRPVRATYHLLESGALPAKRVGGRWVADRKRLMEFLAGADQ